MDFFNNTTVTIDITEQIKEKEYSIVVFNIQNSLTPCEYELTDTCEKLYEHLLSFIELNKEDISQDSKYLLIQGVIDSGELALSVCDDCGVFKPFFDDELKYFMLDNRIYSFKCFYSATGTTCITYSQNILHTNSYVASITPNMMKEVA